MNELKKYEELKNKLHDAVNESISLSILVCVMGVDGSRKNTHGRKSK